MKSVKSEELTQSFNRLYPGGHSNYRVPLFTTQHKVFVDRAEGSRVWDVDGNEYVDYLGAMGPTILGHRHPEYVQALKDFMDRYPTAVGSGVLFSEDDIIVAEKLIKHIPCAEKVKFCITGSEAVQLAIRLARAYTGRPYFVRFFGHYHGWMDNVLGGILNPDPGSKPFAFDDPNSDPFTDYCFTRGKAPEAVKESFLLPWNDLEALESTIEKHAEEIAVIHLEALVCNHFNLMPKPGYLERMRELCTRHGILLSFDEVITGFRLGLGGAQQYFGVTPDMATLGKALAGGMPLSAVVGRADIMNLLEESQVLGPGTFNGYPLGMRAARTTIEILERDNGAVYQEMENVQNSLSSGLSDLAVKYDMPMLVQGAPGVFFTMFGLKKNEIAYTDEDLEALDFDKYLLWWIGLQEQGVLTLAGGRWYPTIVHNNEDTAKTLEAAEKVMAGMKG